MSANADAGAGAPRRVTMLLPAGYRDPLRPSGGNIYDAHLVAGLRRRGWRVTEVEIPAPSAAEVGEPNPALDAALSRIPGGTLVLIDGLLASPAAAALTGQSGRLSIVVVLHLPMALDIERASATEAGGARAAHDELARSERAVLAAASGVITTSRWTAAWVARQPGLERVAVTVATPGAEPAPLTAGSRATGGDGAGGGQNLLFLGRLVPHKGVDVLVRALAALADLPWQCWLAGPDGDPALADRLRAEIVGAGLADRLHLPGVLAGSARDVRYAATDLLILPSLFETYGMVVTEAIARGIPVIATDVGGVAEALGRDAQGRTPGTLVGPGDAGALAAAIRGWLTDARCRRQWAEAARARRRDLRGWDETTAQAARALSAAR